MSVNCVIKKFGYMSRSGTTTVSGKWSSAAEEFSLVFVSDAGTSSSSRAIKTLRNAKALTRIQML